MAVKQTIRFEDLDGNPVEEDWYFSLTEADLSELDFIHDQEDLSEYLKSIQESDNKKEMLNVMRQILFASAGKREGKLLIKDENTRREFRYGGAYTQLFAELLEDPQAGMPFFVSIMPANIQAKVAEEAAKTYTKEELLGMTDEEFKKAAGSDETAYTQEQLLVALQRRNHPAKAA